ncbi:MAG TPA: hypothetical protein VLG28_12795 [Acidimicrobiia bacterium]|nr:hypothetical protein [Acidimicrobiia bacterium]
MVETKDPVVGSTQSLEAWAFAAVAFVAVVWFVVLNAVYADFASSAADAGARYLP